MIRAVFSAGAGRYTGFAVSGHAELNKPGKDILCAAVSSTVMMAANTITEVLKIQADVHVLENEITLQLPKATQSESASAVIEGLKIHLVLLSEEYSERLQVMKDREEKS